MTMDWCSTLTIEQNNIIKKLLELENEIDHEKDSEKKIQKENLAKDERKKLISQNAHLSYHYLVANYETSAENLRSTWQENNIVFDFTKDIEKWNLDVFLKNNIIVPIIDISVLPSYSFSIQFKFTLDKPYLSRDERDFYIIDNPILKDRVFGLPYVSTSSWKGSLRSALWQLDHKDENNDIKRIFGNKRNVEKHDELLAGRLKIFPTFFKQKGLEIINPHDREKRVGTVPIRIESVPKKTSGYFTLLYVPFNFEEKDIKKQIATDIQLILMGLKSMFITYGFGAKTSSSHGFAKSEIEDGKIVLKVKGIEVSQEKETKSQEPEESFKKYLNEDGSVKDIFKGDGESGLLSNSKYGAKGREVGGGSQKEFTRFRVWYKQYGEQWHKFTKAKKIPISEWPKWTFKNFDELEKKAQEIERVLNLIEKETQ